MNNPDNFESLNLNENILKGVYLYGFTQPSKIQLKGIASINTTKDCILQSQSGTGKTATYLLGVLNRLETNNFCQGIIITPTRELTSQVHDVALALSKFTEYKITKCIGGTDIKELKKELKGTNVVIGTLGRIHHMIEDKYINLYKLKFIVLDEADDLLEDGLCDKLHNIFEKAPAGIQVVLISATMSHNLMQASKKIMHEPLSLLLKNHEIVVDLISQFYIEVKTDDDKFETLLDLYELISTSQAIIFCNTIRTVEWVGQSLKENNFPITTIHSKMTQTERNDVVKDFRNGNTRILLTTDLLSRGIDIPLVNLVINFELPIDKETYIHRIGRCGRFDKKGVAITIVKTNDQSDIKTFQRMQQVYKMDIKELPNDIGIYL